MSCKSRIIFGRVEDAIGILLRPVGLQSDMEA
jgi:hypothetical protein